LRSQAAVSASTTGFAEFSSSVKPAALWSAAFSSAVVKWSVVKAFRLAASSSFGVRLSCVQRSTVRRLRSELVCSCGVSGWLRWQFATVQLEDLSGPEVGTNLMNSCFVVKKMARKH